MNNSIRKKPTIFAYLNIIKEILYNPIEKNSFLIVIILFTIILNFVAAHFTIQATLALSKISEHYNDNLFLQKLKDFLYLAILASIVDFFPSVVFTYSLQTIWRKRFSRSLSEILDLNYQSFHSKTPGEFQYAIFLKSYSSSFCFNLLIDKFSSLIANVFWGFYRIHNKINTNVATIFILVPIFYFFCFTIYIKYKINYHIRLLEHQEFTNKSLSDKLLNFDLIKNYCLEEIELKDFEDTLSRQRKTSTDLGVYESFSKWLLSFVLNMPFVLILVIMAVVSENNNTTILSFCLLYTTQSSKIKSLATNLDILIELINQMYFLKMETKKISSSDTNLFFRSNLKVEDWSVYYGKKKIIDRVSLKINKGEKVAVVGKNGTGKSTFIKSIIGFASKEGLLYMDDILINETNYKKFLQNIAYISQDDFTSDDTILNNILLGINRMVDDSNESETVTLLNEVRSLARKFDCDSTFMKNKNGYFTEVGPRGINISGGEKQKIALLRACLKNSDIFIFDEATSSLDKKFEFQFVKTIFNNLSDKTLIMIIHGKDLLKSFDKIIFINDSKIEAIGKYEDLIENNQKFKILYQ